MTIDRLRPTLVIALATAGLAILMATIIYHRAASHATPGFVAVAMWQLMIWLPWVALAPLVDRINQRFRLQTIGAVTWLLLQLLFAIVFAAVHSLWFFQVSDYLSPYRGVPGTKYGAFAYFFIYWFLIDMLLYWALTGFCHSRRSNNLLIERGEQVAQLEVALQHLEDAARSPHQSADPLQFFLVKRHGEQRVIGADQIDWIEAQGYYAALHVGDDVSLVRTSLAELAQKLDPERFVRIHRSTLVSISFIRSLDKSSVTLADGTLRRISRSGRGELRKRILQLA